MFGNAWAGTAKYKNFPNEIPVTELKFVFPSGNLETVSYPKDSSLSSLYVVPPKYGNFKYLNYFKCDNGTTVYSKYVKKENAESVDFFESGGRCWVYLVCNDGYYVDSPTHTTADKCIKQNTVSVVDKKTGEPLKGVSVDYATYNTDSEGKTLSWCPRDKDNVCVELAGYKKQCQTCAENMVFKLEKIVKNPKKTKKPEEKESAKKPVTPPAETDGATGTDKKKETNLSGEGGGGNANETPAETENENGTATADDDDKSTESAGDESNENEQFSFAKLDAILDKYFSDSSNWKNEDGNFNTARLVSDSVAGVVLGTAGGVITSKIIKKNQIKKGFEDLKCTVGGQEVATYGDEFTVGAKQ